jgi:hypothetical protein
MATPMPAPEARTDLPGTQLPKAPAFCMPHGGRGRGRRTRGPKTSPAEPGYWYFPQEKQLGEHGKLPQRQPCASRQTRALAEGRFPALTAICARCAARLNAAARTLS